MNLKPLNFFLLLMVVTDFSRTVLSFDSKCPLLRLVSGRSRYRWRGRSVRFNCMRGFQLVGVKYAICMNGKWDADVPICVKYGCQVPSTTHVNGQFIESYRGAVVKIVCNPGYTLVGSPSVYCNGVRWNETFPVCRVKNTHPALSCDFENSDLCGWSQDPMHDFHWKRQNSSALSGSVGTGPVFDHTKGENGTGHYMYMESSNSKIENDNARLYSPVYPPEYSNGTCFSFWYCMHGAGTGFLKVYVKLEGVELYNLIPSFWIYGEQGTSWIQSFFPIAPTTLPFQIVIEGMKGTGVVGYTAFDDVNLTSIEECKTLEEMTSSTEFSSSVNPDDDVVDFFSCKNRCNSGKANATFGDPEDEKCNCYETCDRDGTCCSDYFDFCAPFPSTSTTTEPTYTSTLSSPSTAPSSEPEDKLPLSKPTPSIHFNNESNEIDPEKPFVETARSRTIPTSTTTTRKTTTLQPSPEKNETEEGKNSAETKTNQRKIMVGVEKKLPKPVTNRTKNVKMPVITTSNEIPHGNGKTEEKAEVTSSVSTTTPRAFKSSKPNNIKLTFLGKPSSPDLSNESRFNKGRQNDISGKEPPQAIKIDKPGDTNGGKIQRAVEVGGAAFAILVIIIFGVFWYKRRENRKSERKNMVEDSDSIVYEMDSSLLGSESDSLVCVRPGSLLQT